MNNAFSAQLDHRSVNFSFVPVLQDNFLKYTALIVFVFMAFSTAVHASVEIVSAVKIDDVFQGLEDYDLEGVAVSAEGLWIVDEDNDDLYLVDLTQKKILRTIELNPFTGSDQGSPKPAGIEGGVSSLWLSDEDGKVYQLDPATGKIISVLNDFTVEGDALATNGENFWFADQGKINKFDIKTGEIQFSYDFPGKNFKSLTFAKHFLLAGDNDGLSLYRIDSETAKILETYDMNGLVQSMDGLAWDEKHCLLWVISHESNVIVQADLGGALASDICH